MQERDKLLEYLKEIAYEVGYGEGYGWNEYIAGQAEYAYEDPSSYVERICEGWRNLVEWVKSQPTIVLTPADIEKIRIEYEKGFNTGSEAGVEYQTVSPLSEVRRRLRRRLRRILPP